MDTEAALPPALSEHISRLQEALSRIERASANHINDGQQELMTFDGSDAHAPQLQDEGLLHELEDALAKNRQLKEELAQAHEEIATLREIRVQLADRLDGCIAHLESLLVEEEMA